MSVFLVKCILCMLYVAFDKYIFCFLFGVSHLTFFRQKRLWSWLFQSCLNSPLTIITVLWNLSNIVK